jgi:two-component system chemotaxis response regulator CheB
VAIVQDPEDAVFADMPRNALQAIDADHISRLAEIPALLTRLTRTAVNTPEAPAAGEAPVEAHMAQNEGLKTAYSFYTCPDCGGSLTESESGGMMLFRCHVGHAYATQAMLESQADGLERALWVAVRILEEQAAFSRRLASRHQGEKAMLGFTRVLERKAQEADGHARAIRNILDNTTSIDVEMAEVESVAKEAGDGETRK